jgi:hypothetical protein
MAYPLDTVEASPESSPEAETPRRPAAVPEAGVWNAEAGKWEVSHRDGNGAREGECLLYRGDGTLYSRCRFVAGLQEGPFFVYHRDGNVAREGKYIAGRFDGTVTGYASDDPEGEKLRVCCVPPGAARLSERYRAGEFLLEVFYDRQGRAILSDGRLCPARPDGLPELAQFDESRGGWAQRSRELDRFWNEGGTLTEEVAHAGEGARVVRQFDVSGQLLMENGLSSEDRLEGPFFRRFPDSEPSPYADQRIRQERGAYQDGQPTGSWQFLDRDGNVVRAVDRGVALRDGGLASSPAVTAAGGDWSARAQALVAEGRLREAFVAAARDAVAAGDLAPLQRFRAAHVVPLAAEREAQWGEALAQSTDATATLVLDALLCGADAAAAFRALASVLPGTERAASDLVEASLLLAPERRLTHMTRALLRFQRGDRAGALADADIVDGESTEAAESLRTYAAMMFRGFDDWPGQESFARAPELEGVSLEITHDVDTIRHAAGVYATRIERVRAAIRALGTDGAPDWFPPDVSQLLPSGAVPLRRETIECEPEEAGAAPETIDIDEEPVTEGAGVPALLASAHADWVALSWLCWAVGLDRVALPDAVTPRSELPVAMQMIVRRTWRIKDRLASGSLISRSQGVPGFEWQGVDIDALPRHLAELAAAEYIAVRSVLLWLASPDALSPFQDDIRDA